MTLSDDALRNREVWTQSNAEYEDLVELQAPPEAQDHAYYDFVSAEWARRWPSEEIWVARKRP